MIVIISSWGHDTGWRLSTATGVSHVPSALSATSGGLNNYPTQRSGTIFRNIP